MAKPLGGDAWWDESWNPVGGCSPVSPGCKNCYAAQEAGTKTWPFAGSAGIHDGVTVVENKRRIFNGKLTVAPDRHPVWMMPIRWRGAEHPKLGPDKPSLIFVGDMSDLFIKGRSPEDTSDLFIKGQPNEIISRVCGTIAQSEHIGQLLTKRTPRMAAYFTGLNPRTVERWQPQLWLGFSAENQEWFDKRWPDMRTLAEAGWRVFVSVAPMIGAVTLPPDFLAFGPRVWVIVAGEQGPRKRCRFMDANWARAVCEQCKTAGIPFFVKQMSGGAPIPLDLEVRQFPSVP
jgi:protein gp37